MYRKCDISNFIFQKISGGIFVTAKRLHFLALDTQNIKSLRDIVVEALREAIVSGNLKPGERLKERELSEVMGISTTPIKEAFRILGHEGLVVTIPRKGTFVSEVVNSTIEEVLMLRANLEGMAARLAAKKITTQELKALQDKIRLMESLKGKDTDQLVQENTEFHELIRKAAKNPMLYNMLSNISAFDKAFRKRALKLEVEVHEGFNEHWEIFKAIKAKNPDLAEAKMKDHILRTAQNVLDSKKKGDSLEEA